MRKLVPLQIAGKLQYTPTDNRFKKVQVAYMAVISDLDKLVQPLHATYAIRLLARPRPC